MLFWVRHCLMLFLVVIGPVATVLWVDARTEIARAKTAGARDAKRAGGALTSAVALRVRGHVDSALTVAHVLEDAEVLDDVARGRTRAERAVELADAQLANIRPAGGFAWLVDDRGTVVAGMDGTPTEDGSVPRMVGGHPLFTLSQQGYAGDMLWRNGVPAVWAAAAPLVVDGRAKGAIVVGWPIDDRFVSELATNLGVELSLLRGREVAVTTLPPDAAERVPELALASSAPVVAGSLSKALPSPIPGLPLFLGPRADGLAFSSLAMAVPGRHLSWVVSVPAAEALEALAERQLNLLGAGLALAMLVVLFTVITHRAYVRPIGRISEHLSEIQLGRGELEISELRVSRPFRRLVRLINMTVQKLPTRGMTGATLSGTSRAALPSVATSAPVQATLTPASPPSVVRIAAKNEDEALPSDGDPFDILGQPSSIGPATEVPKGDGDADEDIAQAIAALESTLPPEPPSRSRSMASPEASSTQRRSAADIRGGRPRPDMAAIDDEFHEVSQFTLHPKARGETGIRGGGSLDLGQSAGLAEANAKRPAVLDSTAVSPVQEELLARSARDDLTNEKQEAHKNQDMTVVATVDPKLLSQTVSENEGDKSHLEEADWSHFKDVYDQFLALRKKCGEQTQDLVFDRFLTKLKKNRAKLIEKYNCKTVRFQVYEKDGKAALKATPVRAR